jgi:hypothetical protein
VRLALFDTFPDWPLARQTPGGSLRWGDAEFAINPEGGTFDGVVVYDGMLDPVELACPPDRSWFIAGEPPSIKLYDPGFLAQFHAVVTCHTDTPHRRLLHIAQGYPWHAGVAKTPDGSRVSRLGFDELRAMARPPKTKLLSAVISDKAVTPGHRQRRAFVDLLQRRFGDCIDVFGRGIRDIDDKADALLPYRFHVALENSAFADYWTEKLGDAFLCRAFPFYWGAPNLERYFPRAAFEPINIFDPEAAIGAIERRIEAGPDEAALDVAQERMLTEYNIFPMIAHLCTPSALRPAPLHLVPEARFRDSWRKRASRRLRRPFRREKPL